MEDTGLTSFHVTGNSHQLWQFSPISITIISHIQRKLIVRRKLALLHVNTGLVHQRRRKNTIHIATLSRSYAASACEVPLTSACFENICFPFYFADLLLCILISCVHSSLWLWFLILLLVYVFLLGLCRYSTALVALSLKMKHACTVRTMKPTCCCYSNRYDAVPCLLYAVWCAVWNSTMNKRQCECALVERVCIWV